MVPWAFPTVNTVVTFLAFSIPGVFLAFEDHRFESVSTLHSSLALTACCLAALVLPAPWLSLGAAATVLALGGVYLGIVPDRLGEADVVFLAGMAAVLDFWSFLVAAMLGCAGTLVAFVWRSYRERRASDDLPLPFLPGLCWGGLAAFFGRLL